MTSEPVGNSTFPRYAIQHEGLYWGGEGWVTSKAEAHLYSDRKLVVQAMARLTELLRSERRFVCLTVPVEISMTLKVGTNMDEVRRYLMDCTRAVISAATTPPDGCHVLDARILWNRVPKPGAEAV